MMMSAPLPSALLRCCFGTTKGCVLLEHPVENGKHLMRYSHDGAFLASS
jgi:hypothetical protein